MPVDSTVLRHQIRAANPTDARPAQPLGHWRNRMDARRYEEHRTRCRNAAQSRRSLAWRRREKLLGFRA
jgi:hypothetical protein